MNFKIVIKSMDRVKKLFKLSYSKIILKYGLDESQVHIFVSTEKDLQEYTEAFPKSKVILGPRGIARIDNFIIDYFDEAEVYLYLNDDIHGFYELVDNKLKEVEDLKSVLNQLIKKLQDHNLSYGGFYPVPNSYFMKGKKEIELGLSLVMDPLSICINNKDIKLTEIPVELPNGEIFIGECTDAEKCVLNFKSRGGIVRFNRYSAKVEYYAKQGGYQGRTSLTEQYTANYLKDKYPDYIAGVKIKKNGNTSVRLKQLPYKPQSAEYLRDKNGICRFVISMDNELGKQRRDRLNYTFNLFSGKTAEECPDWVKDKMRHRSNIQEKARNGKIGCFTSYVCLLNKIVSEKINNVLILEDDCIQTGDFTKTELGNKPIYLNGLFHHPTNYTKKNKEWVMKLKTDLQLTTGIHEIDWDKFRIVGTWGIYIPKWKQAQEILDKLKSAEKLTTIDSQISKQKLIGKFHYPPLFKHSDYGISNISRGMGDMSYFGKDFRKS